MAPTTRSATRLAKANQTEKIYSLEFTDNHNDSLVNYESHKDVDHR